jgi:hypothetical protein
MHIPFVSKTKNRCSHQTKDGVPCNATPQAGKPYCFFHDPERAEDRTAARRQGGLTSIGKFAPVVPPNLPQLSLKTPEDVGRLYEETINHVRQGQMDLRTANVIRSLAAGLLRTLAALHRHQRETTKATLLGKGVLQVHPSASRTTDPASTHQPETGNLKLETTPTGVPHSRPSASGNNTKQNVTEGIRQHQQTPEAARQRDLPTLPDKGVPRTENNDNQTPDWLLKLQERSMAKIAEERGQKEPKTGVPHSRPSASGNNTKQNVTDEIRQHQQTPEAARQCDLPTLPGKGASQSFPRPFGTTDSASTRQLETGNLKLETAPVGNSKLETVAPTPVRDPDNEPSPIPGLLNRHLNYLKFAGMPVPDSQRKRFHIPQAYVSSMSARKVEFEINSARGRNRPR